MPGRAITHRASGPAAAVAGILTAAALLAVATGSQARPMAAAPRGGLVSQAAPPAGRPSPPAVQPRSGHPFTPVQGDWEGTAGGFAASFNLVLDATRRQRAGVPQYGIQDLVMLRPLACPPSAARYRESVLGGRLPSTLGRYGSLGLARFGLQGGFTGARSATLSGGYALRGCHGTLTWHMHPAVRRTVADGTWTVHWAGGEHSTFRVRAGGRLATSIRLPRSVSACNGLSGTFDGFIGRRGASAISQGGVTLTLRFANEHAAGTLAATGCAGGAAPVTAARTGG
ncbi:MAG: hypothetical protein ACXVR1_07020 [Solirubrobacteraceae bacterium]